MRCHKTEDNTRTHTRIHASIYCAPENVECDKNIDKIYSLFTLSGVFDVFSYFNIKCTQYEWAALFFRFRFNVCILSPSLPPLRSLHVELSCRSCWSLFVCETIEIYSGFDGRACACVCVSLFAYFTGFMEQPLVRAWNRAQINYNRLQRRIVWHRKLVHRLKELWTHKCFDRMFVRVCTRHILTGKMDCIYKCELWTKRELKKKRHRTTIECCEGKKWAEAEARNMFQWQFVQ